MNRSTVALACSFILGCQLRHSSDLSDKRQDPRTTDLVAESQSAPAKVSERSEAEPDDIGPRAPSEGNSVLAYDFDQPTLTITLPGALREISDIAVVSESEIACVQDERGTVFVYDLTSKRITDEVRFASHGDYEGLAVVDSQVYVLRSDGMLFQLSSMKRHPAVQKFDLHLPFKESEGLCLDASHQRLLIAPKSHPEAGNGKDARPIYAFDLRSLALANSPAFEVSVRAIRRFAKRHDLPIPRRPKNNGESMHNALHFMPSAIAVHPQTGEVFIVSAVDHVLVSCDQRGNLSGYTVLDASTFRQPEGIAFLPNGDLLISNEAAGKEATLVLLKPKRVVAPGASAGTSSKGPSTR